MAARKRKVTLNDNWREKIRVGYMMDRLLKAFRGEIEMSNQQLRAGEIVLAKVVPDLARQEMTGKDGGPIKHDVKHLPPDEAYKRMLG